MACSLIISLFWCFVLSGWPSLCQLETPLLQINHWFSYFDLAAGSSVPRDLTLELEGHRFKSPHRPSTECGLVNGEVAVRLLGTAEVKKLNFPSSSFSSLIYFFLHFNCLLLYFFSFKIIHIWCLSLFFSFLSVLF